MLSITQNRLVRHYQESRSKLLEADDSSTGSSEGLPLSDVLTVSQIQTALEDLGISYRERIFTPWVTIWTFLTQVLSASGSCRSAVSRLISWLSIQGKNVCSSNTGAYVQARNKLPEKLFQRLALQVGRALHEKTAEQKDWSFHGRSVKMADGTMLTLADTPENQHEFPQPKTKRKKPTPGFPMLRMLALISASTGSLLDVRIAPCAGEGTGENSLLHQLFEDPDTHLQSGDILLVDRLFCSFFFLATCLFTGVDCVVRLHCSMKTEKFELVKQIAKGDRLVKLMRPKNRVSAYQVSLDSLPESVVLREITYRIHQKGFRPKTIVILTTLLDSSIYLSQEIADLYWSRWNCELDLRAIKSVMQMDELNCKTPEMIRKEIWAYALGYNLVRTVMAQSALLFSDGSGPRTLSFTGALELINAFRPYFLAVGSFSTQDAWERQYRKMLKAISQQKLVHRPGRTEPRAVKRKPSSYCALKVPRSQARQGYWKKGHDLLRRKAQLQKAA